MLHIKQLVLGQLQTNTYLVINEKTGEALIVDPADDAPFISQILADHKVAPVAIFATHGHFDHILAAYELQLSYSIPFLVHSEDIFLVKRLKETAQYFLGREIVEQSPEITAFLTRNTQSIGSFSFSMISVPGHTPGSVCFYFQEIKSLLVGDLLFKDGGVGRTDFEYSSGTLLKESLHKVLGLPENTHVYSGHGDSTTIKHEREFHTN